MKLNEIHATGQDPLMYDILQQRLAKKERIVFWAWDGSEEVNGLLRWIEKDDDEEPTAYMFYFSDRRSHDQEISVMGFIDTDLENAELDKVGDEWHLSIPNPKKVNEGVDDPIAFDLIRKALQKGITVTFDSFYSGRRGPTKFIGKVHSIEHRHMPGETQRYDLVYYELLDDGTWNDHADVTLVDPGELDGIVFGKVKNGMHFFLPNHDLGIYKP